MINEFFSTKDRKIPKISKITEHFTIGFGKYEDFTLESFNELINTKISRYPQHSDFTFTIDANTDYEGCIEDFEINITGLRNETEKEFKQRLIWIEQEKKIEAKNKIDKDRWEKEKVALEREKKIQLYRELKKELGY